MARNSTARWLGGTALGIGAGGLGCLAYASIYEVDAFRLRRVTLPILPLGAPPLRLLHLSDVHLTRSQREKQQWLSHLAALEPDLVVSTGDNLADEQASGYLLRSLGRLLDCPGVYVFGSNDYYGPRLVNPLKYLYQPLRHGKSEPDRPRDLPWRELLAAFDKAGWKNLNNHRASLKIAGLRLDFRGTDDPHVLRDHYAEVAGPVDPGAALTIGVTHAPYARVLDPMTADGVDLIMAGHTHGGQVCVPAYGALVTNCDLDRRRAKGLSTHRAEGREATLHVSAGLGASPMAPFRFACPPEATLLTLSEMKAPRTIG